MAFSLSTHPPFSSLHRSEKKIACTCSCCHNAKIGLLETLRLVLRCAVARHSLSFFCRKQGKRGVHDTRCINRLGLFIIRCRVVETLRVVFAFVLPSAFTCCVVSKVGEPRRTIPPG